MGKLIMGILVFWLMSSFISSFVLGGGGYVAQPLMANVSTTDTTIYVASTAAFLAPSVITIDNEQIAISAVPTAYALTVSTRGYGGTTIAAHYQLNNNMNTMVYSGDASAINNPMQVRIVTLQTSLDSGNVISIGAAIPGLVSTFLTSPLSFFNSDLWVFSAVYLIVGIVLVVILGIAVLGSLHLF